MAYFFSLLKSSRTSTFVFLSHTPFLRLTPTPTPTFLTFNTVNPRTHTPFLLTPTPTFLTFNTVKPNTVKPRSEKPDLEKPRSENPNPKNTNPNKPDPKKPKRGILLRMLVFIGLTKKPDLEKPKRGILLRMLLFVGLTILRAFLGAFGEELFHHSKVLSNELWKKLLSIYLKKKW